MERTLSPNYLLLALSRVYFAVKQKSIVARTGLLIFLSLLGKKSVNIILADDDPDDRELFIEAIEDVAPQVSVEMAHNGKELMNMLLKKEGNLPDIIFLDLNMPLKSGYECLEEIRKNEALKTIPVIIYSTSANTKYIEETFKMGANFYFPKPTSIHHLRTLIKKVFTLDWEELMKPSKEKFVLSINHLKW